MMLSEGQMSDFKGAEAILPDLPKAKELLADKGYDANWFREALAERKIGSVIRSVYLARSMRVSDTVTH